MAYPEQNGMFSLTPYGMGMPQGNQNFFGLGSKNPKQGYGLRMPAIDGPSMGMGQGIDYMGQRSYAAPTNSLQLGDGSTFNGMHPAGKTGLASLFGDGEGFLGSSLPMKDLQLGIGGLQTLGNLWGGFKSLGLAEKQFDFSKMIAEKNLTNSTQSYNTALDDRITSRAKAQGMSEQDRQAYLSKNSLK